MSETYNPFEDPVKLAEAAAIYRRALARPDAEEDADENRGDERQRERAS